MSGICNIQDNKKSVPSRLKTLRKEHGLTQQELADKLNLSRDTISSYENNRTLPIENATLIADLYNVSLDYLYCRSDCKNVDNHYINQVMGLSDKAINGVKSLDQNSKMLLDSLLASDAAKDMLVGLYPFICTIPQDEIKIHDMTIGKENTFNLGLEILKQYAIRTYTQAIEKLYDKFDDYRNAKSDAYIEVDK